MRSFRDSAGRLWGVFAVTPDAMHGVRVDVLPEPYTSGWLVFECADERRRLAPFPKDWEELSSNMLCRMLDEADRVKRRVPHALGGDFDQLSQLRADA